MRGNMHAASWTACIASSFISVDSGFASVIATDQARLDVRAAHEPERKKGAGNRSDSPQVRLYESGGMYREENIVRDLLTPREMTGFPSNCARTLARSRLATVLGEHACVPSDDEIQHFSSLLASCARRSHQQGVRA
jgi:hypothetical protein